MEKKIFVSSAQRIVDFAQTKFHAKYVKMNIYLTQFCNAPRPVIMGIMVIIN